MYKLEVGIAKREDPQYRLQRKMKLLEQGIRHKGSDHGSTSFRRKHLAETLEELGRFDEARVYRRAHLDACRRNVGADHHWTLSGELALAENLEWSGQPAEAVALARHVVEMRPRVRGTDNTEFDRANALLERLGR